MDPTLTLLESARALTFDECRDMLGSVRDALKRGERGKGCLDLLNELYRALRVHQGAAAALRGDIQTDLVYQLSSLLVERRLPPATRALASSLIRHVQPKDSEPRVLAPLFQGYDRALLPTLLPLWSHSASSPSISSNVAFVALCAGARLGDDAPVTDGGADLRSAALLALCRISERNIECQQVEQALAALDEPFSVILGMPGDQADVQALDELGAGTVGGKGRRLSSLVEKLMSTPANVVLEPDGSLKKSFFTVLNTPKKGYTPTQLVHVVGFSALLRYVSAAPHALSDTLKEAVVAYCVRLIDQSGAAAGIADGDGDGDDPTATARRSAAAAARVAMRDADVQFVRLDEAATLAEVGRVLLALVKRDPLLGQTAMALLRRAYDRLPSGAASRAEHAYAHCTLLGSVLEVAETADVLTDVQPLLQGYFTVFLSRHTRSVEAAFETFTFCRKHRRALASGGGNAFAQYFPALLKLFAWAPLAHADDLTHFIPLMATSGTFVELFHLLLDAPLVAAALERQECESLARKAAAGSNDVLMATAAQAEAAADVDGSPSSKRGAERVLYNLLLRSEAGVGFNMWQRESTTLPLLIAFAVQTPLTPLVGGVVQHVPGLLEMLLNILQKEVHTHSALLSALFARIEYVAGLGDYGDAVRGVMCRAVRALLDVNGTLLKTERTAVVDLLADYAPQQLALLCNVVFAVGRKVDDPDTAQYYFGHMEVMAYELASAPPEDKGQLRLTLLVVSCMCKLACISHDELAPRALLCLVSKLRNTSTPPAVVTRCQELVRIVRNPQVGRDLFRDDGTAQSAQSLQLQIVSLL